MSPGGARKRPSPATRPAPAGIRAEDFRAGFGEELTRVLDLSTWSDSADLGAEYDRLRVEVAEAVRREDEVGQLVREVVFPRLAQTDVPGAGVYSVEPDEVEAVHRHLLFPGRVEAVDGVSEVHESLVLTVHALSVALVSYGGSHGTWRHRLLRRPVRQHHGDPVQELLGLLEDHGASALVPGRADHLSELARRAVLSYGERLALLRHASAPWRIGHGSVAPHELLNAGGCTDLVILSIRLLRELIEGHQKFVFVSGERPGRTLEGFGLGLLPLQFAIVGTLRDHLAPFLADWRCQADPSVDLHWDGDVIAPDAWVTRFRDEVASQVVVGLYRASDLSPPRVFHAHKDHAEVAAKIAVADASLQVQSGLPLLLELARHICQSVEGGGNFARLVENVYAEFRAPCRLQVG